jgi:hypothetical protein
MWQKYDSHEIVESLRQLKKKRRSLNSNVKLNMQLDCMDSGEFNIKV